MIFDAMVDSDRAVKRTSFSLKGLFRGTGKAIDSDVKTLDVEKVQLPKRKIGKTYQEKNYPFNFIPEKF